jgi:hypothetical protein
MNVLSVMKHTLRDRLLDQVPKTEKSLNVRLGIGGDDAKTTLEKIPGGWLVDVAAYPETRPAIEQWLALAMEKAWLTRQDDPKESQRWYSVADQLAAICHHANRAYFARRDATQGKEQTPVSEGLMLDALRSLGARP